MKERRTYSRYRIHGIAKPVNYWIYNVIKLEEHETLMENLKQPLNISDSKYMVTGEIIITMDSFKETAKTLQDLLFEIMYETAFIENLYTYEFRSRDISDEFEKLLNITEFSFPEDDPLPPLKLTDCDLDGTKTFCNEYYPDSEVEGLVLALLINMIVR